MALCRLFKLFRSFLNSTSVHVQGCSHLIILIPRSLRQQNWQMFSDYQFPNSDTHFIRDTDTFCWKEWWSPFYNTIIQWVEHRHTWERGPSSFSRTQIHLLFSHKRSHSIWQDQAAAATVHFVFQMVSFSNRFLYLFIYFRVNSET